MQNRNRPLVRRWCRVIRFYARVIQHLGFWTKKNQANVDYCYVRRCAECTSLGPGLKHPSLRSDSSLAAKRRAEALHVDFFQQSVRAQHDELLLCVYSRMIRSHERRALGALLSLFSRCEPRRPTPSCSLAAVRRGDLVRASRLYSQSNASIATRTSVV